MTDWSAHIRVGRSCPDCGRTISIGDRITLVEVGQVVGLPAPVFRCRLVHAACANQINPMRIFTATEHRISRLVWQGHTIPQIGGIVGLGRSTVNSAIRRIKRKIDAADLDGIALYVAEALEGKELVQAA